MVDDLPDGYGTTPPAIGVDILHGPIADAGDGLDNNRNGIVDEPNEDISMSKFVYYNNNNDPIQGEPVAYADYFNYLRGFWKNGVQMIWGGTGYNPGSTDTCDFMFPGTTDTTHIFSNPQDWTEEVTGNVPDDRRLLLSAGQFTMQPGEVNCITMAVIWTRADSGDNHASIPVMLEADSIVQLIFDSCFHNYFVNVDQLPQGNITGIAPNPFSDKTTIHFDNPKGENYSFKLFDLNGTLVKSVFNISNNFLIVERKNLKSGMYIFKLTGENGKASSGKLMVE